MGQQYTLIEAIRLIQRYYAREVSMIEFEDGSYRNFNFKFTGDNVMRFVNMGFIERYYA